MTEMTILIEGMTCAHCIKRVSEALKLAGVEQADVKIGEAKIIYDENLTNLDRIAESLKEAGYLLKR